MAFGSSIIARLGLDSRDFREGVAQAQGILSDFGGKFAALFGGTITVAGLEEGIRKVVEYGSRIQDLSERFNVDAESLQKLGNAAELHGSSLESVARAYNKLEVARARALEGSQAQIQAFDRLNISNDDLRKLKPDELMIKLGKSSGNAADMVAILGKNATELRPTLEGLADGTIKFGKAISNLDIKKLKEADDAWKQLGQRLEIGGGHAVGYIFTLVESLKKHATTSFDDIKTSGTALWEAIKAGAHGNLSEAMRDLQAMAFAAKQAQLSIDMTDWREEAKKNADGTKAKSHTQAAPPDARLLLSLKDLAEKGSNWGQQGTEQGWNGWLGGRPASGTAQALYNADQARRVQELEGMARRTNLLGYNPSGSGETAEQLYNRADVIRQSIASYLKEGDRGSIRSEMDSTSMARDIAIMREELQREE